ncbi:MAG TPA: hypothetical protein ENI39_05895 [Anaerolineae bacterium]|nr:hypothetical protein [Anaerolineae bacterium]
MPLLIDGHNLIGRMPDLSLEEPDDEAELVRRVRRYCRRHRRRATVIFDAGLPGGPAPHLSGGPVEVVFASAASDADSLLCRRIRRARDPRGLVVVSSDQAVQRVARSQGARVVRAEDFAAELTAPQRAEEAREKPEHVGDLEEWLRLFEHRRG